MELANKDMFEVIFNPMLPGVAQTCEFHPALFSTPPLTSPTPSRGRAVIFWRRRYPLKVCKTGPTNADANCPLYPQWCHFTNPPCNGMAAHQRRPCLAVSEASKIGVVVHHMPM